MKQRMSVRIMEMGAGSRVALAAVLAVLLWLAVWWAL
jgi:hypothetical protein